MKVQVGSLEARVIQAEVGVLKGEEERKKQEEPGGRRLQSPKEAEVSAQWAAGLEATLLFNKCWQPP